MTEAFLNTFYGDHFEAYNAGITPEVNPYAIRVMAEVGIDISGQRSKSIKEFQGWSFYHIVPIVSDIFRRDYLECYLSHSKELLESGYDYVYEKEGLMFFRKRKVKMTVYIVQSWCAGRNPSSVLCGIQLNGLPASPTAS